MTLEVAHNKHVRIGKICRANWANQSELGESNQIDLYYESSKSSISSELNIDFQCKLGKWYQYTSIYLSNWRKLDEYILIYLYYLPDLHCKLIQFTEQIMGLLSESVESWIEWTYWFAQYASANITNICKSCKSCESDGPICPSLADNYTSAKYYFKRYSLHDFTS